MMEQQHEEPPNGFLEYKGYNEVILNSDTWVDHLPGTVQAIFMMSDSEEKYKSRARTVRDKFLEEFGVELPLLVYTHGQSLPFSTFGDLGQLDGAT